MGGVTLDPRPLVEIRSDGPDGVPAFGRAVGATRLADGGILVADAADLTVRRFSASGEAIGTSGREGGGPGEFRYLSGLWQCAPDSVFVWDPVLNRISVLNGTGTYIREFQVPSGQIRCSRSGVLTALVASGPSRMPDPRGVSQRVSGRIEVLGADGSVRGQVPAVQAYDYRPAGVRTILALSGSYIVVGTQDSAFVELFGHNGDRAGVLPVGIGGRQLTEGMYAAIIDEFLGGIGPSPQRDSIRASLLRIPRPSLLAPYNDLLAAPNGTLWADVSEPGGSWSEFRATGTDGTPLGGLRLEGRFKAFEVGDEYILGVFQGDESQRIIAYGLRVAGSHGAN